MLTKGLSAHIAARLEAGARRVSHHGTRYAVIDDLLPEDLACSIAAAYAEGAALFTRRKSFRESGTGSIRFDALPHILKDMAFAMKEPEVIAGVERIVGMTGLVADPTSYAGGLTQMERGDFLNPHIDNSHNAARTHYRRVNLLYYPSPDWKPGDGGELELWNAAVTRALGIRPHFNRLVLMVTDRTSWHGVAPVMNGPRRCCSSYYFSAESPDGSDYYHVTSFTGRPGQRVRRMIAPVDNGLRAFARRLGAWRSTDSGFKAGTSR